MNWSISHDLEKFLRKLECRTPALTSPTIPSAPIAANAITETLFTTTAASLVVAGVTRTYLKVPHARPSLFLLRCALALGRRRSACLRSCSWGCRDECSVFAVWKIEASEIPTDADRKCATDRLRPCQRCFETSIYHHHHHRPSIPDRLLAAATSASAAVAALPTLTPATATPHMPSMQPPPPQLQPTFQHPRPSSCAVAPPIAPTTMEDTPHLDSPDCLALMKTPDPDLHLVIVPHLPRHQQY